MRSVAVPIPPRTERGAPNRWFGPSLGQSRRPLLEKSWRKIRLKEDKSMIFKVKKWYENMIEIMDAMWKINTNFSDPRWNFNINIIRDIPKKKNIYIYISLYIRKYKGLLINRTHLRHQIFKKPVRKISLFHWKMTLFFSWVATHGHSHASAAKLVYNSKNYGLWYL